MTGTRRLLFRTIFVFGLLPLFSCPDVNIVPSTQGNHKPWIQVTPQVVDTGALDSAVIETIDSCSGMGGCAFPLNATRYTRIRVVGKIVDKDAGIKSVRLTVAEGNNVLQTVEGSNALDANGRAPGQFGFVGTDGAGGFGVLKTIELVASTYAEITLEATNFENNTNKLIIDVVPHDPVQANISVAPSQIDAGGTAQLSVSGSPNAEWVVNPPTATLFGQANVAPLTTTTYSLTVRQPFSSSTVGFPNSPPATGQQVFSTSKTVSATLTVRATPVPPQNPALLTFYLQLQPVGPADTTYVWKAQFGLNTSGTIVAIRNPSLLNIELIATGKSPDDCFKGTDSTVPLAAGQSTLAADITKLYGTAQYPREIGACAVVPPGDSPPQLLTVVVTYTH